MKGKGVQIIHMYKDYLWLKFCTVSNLIYRRLGDKAHPPVAENTAVDDNEIEGSAENDTSEVV